MSFLRRKAFSKVFLAKRRITRTLFNVRIQQMHLRTQSFQSQKSVESLSLPSRSKYR